MKEYILTTGKVSKKIIESSIDAALRRFFHSLKANQLGICVSVEYDDGVAGRPDMVTKLAPVEISLKRLGMYAKFKKDIDIMRKNKKSGKTDVQDYD